MVLRGVVVLLGVLAVGQSVPIDPSAEKISDQHRINLLAGVNAQRADFGACPLEWSDQTAETRRSTVYDSALQTCRGVPEDHDEVMFSRYVFTGKDDTITWDTTEAIDEWHNPLNTRSYNITLWKSVTKMGCLQCRHGDSGSPSSGYMLYVYCKFQYMTGTEADNRGKKGDKCDLCKNVQCTAIDQCHNAGTCDALTGKCTTPLKPDTTPCNDGNDTTVDDVCTAGVCKGVDRCAQVTCTAQDQCHDAGTCDRQTGVCTNPPKPDGTPCNDGNQATMNDTCTMGTCQGKDLCAGVTCKAKSQCHEIGVCDAQKGVCTDPVKLHDAPCDDGNSATVNDKCDGMGNCIGQDLCATVQCPPSDCRDNGKCNPKTGMCEYVNKQKGTPCDDGNPSTGGDTCDDQGFCSGVDGCSSTKCLTPYNQCYLPGACSKLVGGCTRPRKPVGTACDDGDSTTVNDKCVLDTTANELKCQGENLCSTVDCTSSLDQCHSAGMCDPLSGTCNFVNKPDGTPCDDNVATTVDDVCSNGVCRGEDRCHAKVCKAEQCRIPTGCDPMTGECTFENIQDGTPCDDGNNATLNDACESGKCVGKELCKGVSCKPTQCHVSGVCSPATGRCLWDYQPDGTPCDDGDSKTVLDRCIGGKCVGGGDCGVELIRKHSRSDCTYGVSYGFTPEGKFYVDDGCRGFFRITSTKQEFKCSSWGWKYKECNIFPLRPICNTKTLEPCPTDKACPGFIRIGEGKCLDKDGSTFDAVVKKGLTREHCMALARSQAKSVIGVEYVEHELSCSLLLPQGEAAMDTFGQKWDSIVTGRTGQAPVRKTDNTPGMWCWVPEDRCVNVKCEESGCRDAGVCEPQTGLCTNPPKPEGSYCDDQDPTTWNDRCTKNGTCVGQKEKQCWRAASWYRSQTCINDPSACSWAYGVYPSEDKCCERSFRNGCKPKRTGCWMARGYWPLRDCVDRSGSSACHAPSGVFDSKDECCAPRKGAFRHGCSGWKKDDNDDNDDGVADRPEQCQCDPKEYQKGFSLDAREYCASDRSPNGKGRACAPLNGKSCERGYSRCTRPQTQPTQPGKLCLCGSYMFGAQASYNRLCVGASTGSHPCYPVNSNGKCGRPDWSICVGKRGFSLRIRRPKYTGVQIGALIAIFAGQPVIKIRIVSICRKSSCRGPYCGGSRRSMRKNKGCQTGNFGVTPSRHLQTLEGEDEGQVVTWEFTGLDSVEEDQAIEKVMTNMELAVNGTDRHLQALSKGRPDLLEALRSMKEIAEPKDPMVEIEAPADMTEEDIAEASAAAEDGSKGWMKWAIPLAVLGGCVLLTAGAVFTRRRRQAMESEDVGQQMFVKFTGSPDI